MKKINDPRHLKRRKLVQFLFADCFQGQNKSLLVKDKILYKIKDCQKEIDLLIEKAAPQFPIEKIAKIDASILRLAVFELVFLKKEPPKVIIDEAIELAKEFGGENSSAFINGVLGHLVQSQKIKI